MQNQKYHLGLIITLLLDIFSSLDYRLSFGWLINNVVWIIGILWLFFVYFRYFYFKNIIYSLLKFLKGLYYKNFASPKNYIFFKNLRIILRVVIFIVFVNLWALLPYVYGVSTNIAFGLTFALSFWLILQISGIEFHINNYVGHFVSFGSPLGLGFPLVFVDILSSVVRPLTLTLRLVIKMSIGHVIFRLLGLVGSNLFFKNFIVAIIVLCILLFFFIVECCVRVIQSLVFGLLMVNYLGEHR